MRKYYTKYNRDSMKIKYRNISTNKWQLEKIPGMKAEAVFYAKEEMLEDLDKDLSLSQLAEAAMLPEVISPVIGMPDIHEGFGLPIGGVMATKGLISVGAVGMDINCGVRLLTSQIPYNPHEIPPEKLRLLINKIEREIPVGVGGERKSLPAKINLEDICLNGAEAIINSGFGTQEDLSSIEEGGKLAGARMEAITSKALKRAKPEIGTLGSGNHFIEIQKLEKVFDKELADKWGLFEGQICLMIHSGSRALGHQTCTDYTEIFWNLEGKYKISVPRKGLAALPIDTKEGQDYFSAMAAAVNFAFANRQLMTYFVREAFSEVFHDLTSHLPRLTLLYDVAHNIAKWESFGKLRTSPSTDKQSQILIHRKGATRALPPHHPLLPEKFKETGQPAIVPGSMGTASYVIVGTPKAVETFFSVNHGAGRRMSRTEAIRTISKEEFTSSMGQVIHNLPYAKVVDEAPGAYKDIDLVVETLVEAGITKKVAKLVPLAVIKGD